VPTATTQNATKPAKWKMTRRLLRPNTWPGNINRTWSETSVPTKQQLSGRSSSREFKAKLQHGLFSPQRENSEERLVATALGARPQCQQSSNSLIAHRRKSLKQNCSMVYFHRKEKTAKSVWSQPHLERDRSANKAATLWSLIVAKV
jgi:hypothetical protein